MTQPYMTRRSVQRRVREETEHILDHDSSSPLDIPPLIKLLSPPNFKIQKGFA
jgi:hypothetical protein